MIRKFAVYRPETGDITRIVTLTLRGDPSPEEIAAKGACQACAGEAVIELELGFAGNDLTHRIENGTLVPVET